MKPKVVPDAFCLDCDAPAIAECTGCNSPLCPEHARVHGGLCEDCYKDETQNEYIDPRYQRNTVQAY